MRVAPRVLFLVRDAAGYGAALADALRPRPGLTRFSLPPKTLTYNFRTHVASAHCRFAAGCLWQGVLALRAPPRQVRPRRREGVRRALELFRFQWLSTGKGPRGFLRVECRIFDSIRVLPVKILQNKRNFVAYVV